MLQIMLGNASDLSAATFHWVELFIGHFLYIRPFTAVSSNDIPSPEFRTNALEFSGIQIFVFGLSVDKVLNDINFLFATGYGKHV